MRLLHCISSLDPAGGGPIEVLRQQIAVLERMGHRLEIACLDAPDAPWLKDSTVTVHALGPFSMGGFRYSPRWKPWMQANCRRFDAVIINGLWQYQGWGTWQALPAGFPYFVFPHGMLDPWFKRTYPLKHLKKWLYWPWAEYRVLRDARAVFFTAEDERRLARQSFWLYRCSERLVTIGTAGPLHPLAPDRVTFFRRFPFLGGKKILLFLGRLHEKKGVDLLCRAWAKVRVEQAAAGAELVLAGPGHEAYVADIRQLIGKLGLTDSVHLTGMLSGPFRWGALAAADAFILPSHQENFGMAVAESLACSTPVLISNRVNIWREIVEDGAGLAETDDLAGTERLIRTWLAEGGESWAARRQAARACFERRFTIAASADSLIREISAHLPESHLP